MSWFYHLLGLRPEENMTVSAAEISFRELIPLWLGLVLLALGIAWTILIYAQEKGTLGWPRRILGMLLRSTIIAIVLFLLLQPMLLVEFSGEYERKIALLLDNSQSLRQEDRRITQADKARVLLAKDQLDPEIDLESDAARRAVAAQYKADPSRLSLLGDVIKHPRLKLLDGLSARGPVQPLLFGARVHGLRDDGADAGDALSERVLRSVSANEAKTALADAILDLLHRKDTDLPAALVVFSDGRDNHSKYTLQEAALECARLKVPVHVVGLGSAEAGILRIKHVALDETLFAEDIVTLPLHFQAQGLGKGTLEITATLDGKPLKLKHRGKDKDQIEMTAAEGDDLRESLSFEVPKGEAGDALKDLTVRVKLRGDKSYQDAATGKVRVVDDKVRVLYIENTPRFQYKFLKEAMLRDRRLEPKFLLVQSDKESAGKGPFLAEFPRTRKEFFDAKYNVVILGDVMPRMGRGAEKGFLTEEQLEWLREFVQKRGGLVAIAGRQAMPAAYAGTPLEEVLPVIVKRKAKGLDPDERTLEFPPTPTEIGLRRTSLLSLEDVPEENIEVWNKLPGFHWFYAVDDLRPGAESLLINPRARMGEGPMPIMASQFYGDQGQVVFMGSDESWRWRYNVEDKYFARFWGQILLELGKPTLGTSAKRVHFEMAGAQATLGQENLVYARLLDKEFMPLKDKEVEGKVTYIDAAGKRASEPVKLLRQKDGRYLAALNPSKPGKYELTITHPESTTYAFPVNPPRKHELEPAGLDDKGLRDLAAISGGRFYREEDLRYLPEAVESQKVAFTRRQEVLLWNWLFFVIFLLLITGEWLLRKFSNLS